MLWRRSKIHELGSMGKFRQEYPIDVTEAFASADIEGVFIKPALVLRARKRVMDDPDAPLIIGVDPAGSGGDRFAVAFRRGTRSPKSSTATNLSTTKRLRGFAAFSTNTNPTACALIADRWARISFQRCAT